MAISGSNFFKKELTVYGVRIVAAGDVGGQAAVPDAFIEKVAQTFKLLLNKDDPIINSTAQITAINTLAGANGTYHAGMPTIQRIARGAGADYTPNFLTDEGIIFWELSDFFDATVQNDMVWYLNSTGDAPGDGDNDAQEVLEHVMHTLHMHGLDAVSLKMYPFISADWATGPLYNAMVEAYDGGFWDSSGYGGDTWKTDGDAFEVAAKEYLYLLNFCMFDYSDLWEGASLAPEWLDTVKTPAGIQANLPLGFALYNLYISPVISIIPLETIRSIFQDGDVGDPTAAGSAGYITQQTAAAKVLEDSWNSNYWNLWVPGLDFDGVYNENTIYQPGDIVLYGGYLYQSLIINNINNKPSFNAGDSTDAWELVSQAFDMSGAWNNIDEYKVGSVVTYGGNLYAAIADSTNQVPGNFEVAAIYESTGSSGTTLILDTQDSTNPLSITVGMTVIGEGFARGQTVQSVSTDGNISTVILNNEPDGEITDGAVLSFVGTNWSYWELMVPGFNWKGKWIDSRQYNQDDVVFYGNATYQCTREHSSALVSRPDLDLQNLYWIVYLPHDPTNALTQIGQLITTSGGVKTALDIGEQTNVLKVVGDLPSWTETDFTPNVYYVATNGIDAPDRGTTADTSWRTVKYACEQVAQGTQKQNEKTLLELNKEWVIDETWAWTSRQIANNVVPFSSSFLLDEVKTRRDAQYVFDGIVTDLSRGQNARTVTNALTYFDLESTNQFANESVAEQAVYYTAVLGQLFNNIELALTNTAPSQNYQVLDGVVNPVPQYFNNSLTIDGDTISILNSLEKIIREPIEEGSPTSIPPANQGAYTTINIKSGTYEEILPIVIPTKTALNGDELRGATIKPLNPVNTLCTRTVGFINQFIVGSTENITHNTPVQFVSLNPIDEISTIIGGPEIIQGNTYYVIGDSITDTSFQVSATKDGPVVELQTNIGNMYVYGGNALNDMFYVQNATGIRNMTITGLLGTLTPINQYETRRPTGGAYVSLDPGTGPEDTTAWITLRSPYVQNVTTFGNGCTGLKIDSTLHNGGNTSIVCNDFTQIISDGIGIWCTGGDALVEAVSVFSYYNYAGYFAEDGGRVRATNGNSSYGQFGCIAEGFDDSETPASGTVNNRSNQALANAVGALGVDAEILRLQFTHAGEEYYSTTTNLLQYSNNFLETTKWITDGNLNITKSPTTPFENETAWRVEGITNLSDSSYFYQDIVVSPQGRTYTNIAGSNIDGSGIDATFDVTVFSDRYIVSVNNSGSGYVVGNQISISGQNFGGSILNDIVVTVDTLSITSILTISHIGIVPEGSALPYTASIYAKKQTSSYFDIEAVFSGYETRTSSARFNFDTEELTMLTSPDGGIVPTTFRKDFVENGWWRISFTFWDETAQNTSLRYKVYPRGTDGLAGTTNFYGSQLQLGLLTFFLETQDDISTAYANIHVSGAGRNAEIIADELRSGAVFQTRILENSDLSEGGLGYNFKSNNAQGGDDESLILAQSEVSTPSEYETMRLLITSGAGAGQYGIISRYDEVTKTAQILKESFDSLEVVSSNAVTNRLELSSEADFHTVYEGQRIQFIPTVYSVDVSSTSQDSIQVLATLGDLNNYMYVSSTAKLRVNQKINFTGTTFGGVINNADYYILNIIDDQAIQISTTLGGGVWPLNNINIEDPDGAPIVLISDESPFTLNYPANTSYLFGTSTDDMEIAQSIKFTGTSLGDIVLGDTYFIHEIYNANQFSISANKIDLTATATTSTSSAITIADTSPLVPLNPVIFKRNLIGGLQENVQYWVNGIIDGTDFTLSSSIITNKATASAAVSNLITVDSTSGFVTGNPIIFTGSTFGGIVNDKVYYIQVVNNATSFTISETPAGAAVPLLAGTGEVIVRTSANTVTVTDDTGSMEGLTPGEKEVVTAAGAATMEASFFTETFGGVNTDTYYVLEKFEKLDTTDYTDTNNWNQGGATNFTNNQLTIDAPVTADPAFINELQQIAIGDTIILTDSTFGTLTITIDSLWTPLTGPAAGETFSVDIVETAPGTVQNITTIGFSTDGSTLVKEFTVETVQGSGTPSAITTDTGSMQIGAVGWDHVNPGTPITTDYNSTTVYTIEPRVVYSSPEFTQEAIPAFLAVSDYEIMASNGNTTILFPTVGPDAIASSDLTSWTNTITLPVSDPAETEWADACYGNSTWVLISKSGNCLYSVSEGVTWLTSTLPTLGLGDEWTSLAYGNGVFIAVARNSSKSAYSVNNGGSWTEVDTSIGDDDWVDITYGNTTFVAISGSSHTIKYSKDNGVTWIEGTLDTALDSTVNNWSQIKYGNGRFVAVSSDERSSVYSFDGVTWYESNLFVKGTLLEYGNGVFVLINVDDGVCCQSDDGVNWRRLDGEIANYTALTFTFDSVFNKGYFVTIDENNNTTKISTGAKAFARVRIDNTKVTEIGMQQTGSGYVNAPTFTIIDPNNSQEVVTQVRIGEGVLGSPTFINYGLGYNTASTTITIRGSGFSDAFQTGLIIVLKDLTRLPQPGDNIQFAGNDEVYRVAKATILKASVVPNLECEVQLSPRMTEDLSPVHNSTLTMRSRFSQVRLTNHDFLNIGFGNQLQSNYPFLPENTNLEPQNEIQETNNGRVFYSSTDQDGNFRVGDLFAVEQATGIVTLSADEFGLEGLSELSIGGVALGGSPVVVTAFSTDGTFVANSNNLVPTQRAIKTYLTSRLSQGGSDTFTGLLQAGTIKVGGPDIITSTVEEGDEGFEIKLPAKTMFDGPFGNSGWGGDGLAMSYFMKTIFDPTRSGQQ